MQWHDLLVALAMVMVWEGLMPSMNPPAFRRFMQKMIELDDKTLRMMGLTSMIAGAALLYFLRH